MNLNQKLNRIERLLRIIMRLEGPMTNALHDFSHSHAQLDQVRLFAKNNETANRQAVQQVENATTTLLDEMNFKITSEWDRTVDELSNLGVDHDFHQIGTARRVYSSLRSYMIYLELKNKSDREGKPFASCWIDQFNHFANEFHAVKTD